MAVIYTTDWPGADSDPWPVEFTPTTSNGSLYTVGGQGALVVLNVSGATARAILDGVAAQPNLEVLFQFQWSSNDAQSYLDVWLGNGGWSGTYRPENGGGFELRSNAATAVVQKNVGGTVSTIETKTVTTVTTNLQWARIQIENDEMRFRVWADGGSEPATWNGPYDVSDVPGDLQLYLAHNRAGFNIGVKTLKFDNLTVDDLSVPDTTDPTTSITSPLDGATINSGVTSVTATAADNVGVTEVELFVDNVKLASDMVSPYTFSWTATDGVHTLHTVAWDAAGNSRSSDPVSVTVVTPDTTDPTTSITSPLDGAILTTGTVTVTATASDNVGVHHVDFQVDGVTQSTDSVAPYTFDWPATPGSYVLRAIAYDAASNTGTSDPVSVTVQDPPPPVPLVVEDDEQLWELLMEMNIIVHPAVTVSGSVVNCRKFVAVGVSSSADATVNLRDGSGGDILVQVVLPTDGGSKIAAFAGGTIRTGSEVYVEIASGSATVVVYGV